MVQLYSRDGCASCKTLKYLLTKLNVEFTEHEADRTMPIVPVVKIGDVRIEGYNLPYIKQVLGV